MWKSINGVIFARDITHSFVISFVCYSPTNIISEINHLENNSEDI